MILKYKSYFLGAKESTSFSLDFLEKNVVKQQTIFDAIDRKSTEYYIIYNYMEGVYHKFNLNNELLSSGKINYGYWTSDIVKSSTFVEFNTYKGFECIVIKEKLSFSEMYYYLLDSNIFLNYIDKEYLDLLSISSKNHLKYNYQGFGIVGKKLIKTESRFDTIYALDDSNI